MKKLKIMNKPKMKCPKKYQIGMLNINNNPKTGTQIGFLKFSSIGPMASAGLLLVGSRYHHYNDRFDLNLKYLASN